MNLSLTQNDPANTLIIRPETGAVLYDIMTDGKLFIKGRKSHVVRVTEDGRLEVGLLNVGLRVSGKTSVVVSGRDITPSGASMFNKSESFTASNGHKYTWKVRFGKIKGVFDAHENEVVLCNEGRRSRLRQEYTQLNLTPQVIPIVDEIVATFVYMAMQKEKRKRVGDAISQAAGGAGC